MLCLGVFTQPGERGDFLTRAEARDVKSKYTEDLLLGLDVGALPRRVKVGNGILVALAGRPGTDASPVFGVARGSLDAARL
jgi:hypothetical protein